MAFGLNNALVVFQGHINDMLQDFLIQFVFVCLDDILSFSRTLEEHIQHVCLVLQQLLENRLYAKAEKCEFHQSSVQFLWFILAHDHLEMDPEKTRVVAEWTAPETWKKTQLFLGFVHFYRRFIRNYSSVAAPLTALTSSTTPFT